MSSDSTRKTVAISGSSGQAVTRAGRSVLRRPAALLFGGVLLSLVAGTFHADREPANHHTAAFAEYASSGIWTTAHLGQFVGMTVLIAGLLTLFWALDTDAGALRWIARLGAGTAVATLALYGVLQAVDGVALKHAVDAWVSAPEAEKAARFASAEAIRWLEWGTRSYHSFMLGLSLVFGGIVIAVTARAPRTIGALMGLSGLAYVAQGWVIGAEGFPASNTIPTLLGILLIIAWSIGLLVSAWRAPAE